MMKIMALGRVALAALCSAGVLGLSACGGGSDGEFAAVKDAKSVAEMKAAAQQIVDQKLVPEMKSASWARDVTVEFLKFTCSAEKELGDRVEIVASPARVAAYHVLKEQFDNDNSFQSDVERIHYGDYFTSSDHTINLPWCAVLRQHT